MNLLIWTKTDLGYKAIINNNFPGILYSNEIFQNIEKGQRLTGYIKKIRDDDKIDLTLSKPDYEKIEDITERIIALLKENEGYLPISDKSPAELIYELFNESKKTFKKAIGILFKQRLIVIEDEGIRLTDTKIE